MDNLVPLIVVVSALAVVCASMVKGAQLLKDSRTSPFEWLITGLVFYITEAWSWARDRGNGCMISHKIVASEIEYYGKAQPGDDLEHVKRCLKHQHIINRAVVLTVQPKVSPTPPIRPVPSAPVPDCKAHDFIDAGTFADPNLQICTRCSTRKSVHYRPQPTLPYPKPPKGPGAVSMKQTGRHGKQIQVGGSVVILYGDQKRKKKHVMSRDEMQKMLVHMRDELDVMSARNAKLEELAAKLQDQQNRENRRSGRWAGPN